MLNFALSSYYLSGCRELFVQVLTLTLSGNLDETWLHVVVTGLISQGSINMVFLIFLNSYFIIFIMLT